MSLARYQGYVSATLAKRIPGIIRNAATGYQGEAAAALDAVGNIVETDGILELDLANWPLPGWEELPALVDGKRVSEATFFDFEYWMYARMAQAVRFPETGSDPFRATKHRDLERHLQWADGALAHTSSLAAALALSLDANAHDLSQLSVAAARYEVGRGRLGTALARITRMNLIADNFGGEFVADLVLAILASEAGIETVLHVKRLPMFVSDTTITDVEALLAHPSSGTFMQRLHAAVEQGALRFAAHPFWSAPRFLDALPVAELGTGDGVLNILKGDLNYASIGIAAPSVTFRSRPKRRSARAAYCPPRRCSRCAQSSPTASAA
ncbi:MAG: ARMT1-like domain-containing protein [Devosia sp.]